MFRLACALLGLVVAGVVRAGAALGGLVVDLVTCSVALWVVAFHVLAAAAGSALVRVLLGVCGGWPFYWGGRPVALPLWFVVKEKWFRFKVEVRVYRTHKGVVAGAYAVPGLRYLGGFSVSAAYGDWLDYDGARSMVMSLIRKIRKGNSANGTGLAAADLAFAERWPAIHEYMTLEVLEGGEARKTATLTFFCEQGTFKVCLNERDQDATLWAAAAGFEACLDALEGLLQCDSPPWRFNTGGGTSRRKAPKKED